MKNVDKRSEQLEDFLEDFKEQIQETVMNAEADTYKKEKNTNNCW